jgi:hypothetical protein
LLTPSGTRECQRDWIGAKSKFAIGVDQNWLIGRSFEEIPNRFVGVNEKSVTFAHIVRANLYSGLKKSVKARAKEVA